MKLQSAMARHLIVLAALVSTGAYAAEVSLVSGLYKKSATKTDGKNAGSTSSLGLGGRYHDDLGGSMAWYGSGNVTFNSYTAADGRSSPDNAVSLSVGGGVRHYFKPFGTAVVPFGAIGADIRNGKKIDWTSGGYNETTTNGLFYTGIVGLRAGLDSNFFVELELPLFDSSLFSVAKTVSVDESTGTKVEKKTEVTTTELWVDTQKAVTSTVFSVGYKF